MPLGDPDPELAHPEAAGWVLGVLDADDADRFARHLESCPDCRVAVGELGPAARLLQTAAPAAEPPPSLQAATLARVEQAAAAVRPTVAAARPTAGTTPPTIVAARPTAGTTPPTVIVRRDDRRSRWRRWNVRMVALAAAVVIVAAIGTGLALSHSPSPQTYTIALSAGPGQAASGQAVVQQTGSGWSVHLTLAHLPELGSGQFYECWWIGPGNRPGHPVVIAAGTFTVGSSGTATVQMSSAANPDTFTTVQITAQSSTSAGQPGRIVFTGTATDSD
jgi:anti-sigma-K factor RskA